jgi:hypothetical protein
MESVTFAGHWGAVTLLTDKGPLSTQRGPAVIQSRPGFPPDDAARISGERVAQTVEHVTFNHGVLGSIPSALTKEIKDLGQTPRNDF